MFLKAKDYGWINSRNVVYVRSFQDGSSWALQAATASAVYTLAGTYASQAEADAALTQLMEVLGSYDFT